MNVKADVFSRLPPKLVEKLMPFQRDGVDYAVKKRGRCLIADEMGLGKTLQAISVAYYYRQEWPLLIVVPSSLRYAWIEEFEKWLPDIDPTDFNLVQSGIDVGGIETASVTLVTYGLLSKGSSNLVREALKNKQFKVIIVDESHYIRNIKTASCKAIVPLIKTANRRILLSGTPALARPVELYPQIDAVCPGEFGSWWSYTAKFCDAKLEWIGRTKHRRVDGASNLQELQSLLSSKLMIRREKSQVLTQLPPKQRQKVLFDLKDSDLKKEIRKTFEELRPLMKQKTSDLVEVLTGAGETEVKDFTTLSLIQKLYQLSGDAKIGPAKEYVELLCDNPNLKFLVFAYHHAMMNGLTQSLYDKKVKFIRIDGETPPSERPQLVHQFQSDPDTRVAILSILAAGVGLTFTAATVVVFAEMYWTPGVMLQCEDRAHRIGQTSCVAIHYLVAKDTMDEWVWSAVCKKTIVTSTTLTGKKKVMEADAGDQYQVDVLSNADAWVPAQNQQLDLSSYFQSQQPSDQKSILQFFSPSQSKVKAQGAAPKNPHITDSSEYPIHCSVADEDSPPAKRARNDLVLTPVWKQTTAEAPNNQAERTSTSSQKSVSDCKVVLIDSDTDDDFQDKSSAKKLKQSKSRKKKNFSTPQNSKLAQMFNKVSQKTTKEGRTKANKECSELTFDGDMSLVLDSDICGEASILTEPNRQSTNSGSIFSNAERERSHIGAISNTLDLKSKVKQNNGVHQGPKADHQWSCASCTFLNHQELVFCEMCESPRHKEKDNCRKRKNCTEDNVPDMCSGGLNEKVKFSRVNDFTVTNHDGVLPVIKYKAASPVVHHADEMESGFITEHRNQSGSSALESQSTVHKSTGTSDFDISKTQNKPISSHTNSPSNTYTVSRVGKFSFKKTALNSPKSSLSTQKYTSSEVIDKRRPCLENPWTVSDADGKNTENTHVSDPKIEMAAESGNEIVINSSTSNQTTEMARSAVDQNRVPVHSVLRYRCSKYTGRIFLLDKDDSPLNVNFLPIDIEVGNHNNLPDILCHPGNMKLVQRFVREWQSLTETKKRLLVKSGQSFISPVREYENLRSCQSQNTQRHRSKIDTTIAAKLKAAEVSGSVRVIAKDTKYGGPSENKPLKDMPDNSQMKGIVQAVDGEGVPLCVHCQEPYKNILLEKSTITSEENAWQTRFCSHQCSYQYWMKTNSEYCRERVYEVERGICQLCHLDANSLYKQVRDTLDLQKRAELISNSKLSSLTLKHKQQLTRRPVAGGFWHVDHIIPVWEGGGQCDIDNLRTLCVVCHQKITAEQAKKRARVRKLGSAVNNADISNFFQKS